MNKFQPLFDAMDRPEEWLETSYELIHIPTGVSIWITSGFMFFALRSPSKARFPPFTKIRLWFKAQRLRRNMALIKFVSAYKVPDEGIEKGQWIQ